MKKLFSLFVAISALTITMPGQNAPGTIHTSFISGDNEPYLGANFSQFKGNYNSGKNFVQPDGKIIITGSFTSYNGYLSRGIVRILPDGRVDSSFVSPYNYVPLTTQVYVNCAALSNTNKIAVAVYTVENPGTSAIFTYYLHQLNTDGSIDPTFSSNIVWTGPNGGNVVYVNSMVYQADGRLLVASKNILSINGDAFNAFVRRLTLTGSIDPTFNLFPNTGGGQIDIMKVQPDNKILIGGYFGITSNGVYIRHIARINSDGSLDNTFNTGSGNTAGVYYTAGNSYSDGSFIKDIVVLADSSIIISGTFRYYNTVASRSVIKLNYYGAVNPNYLHNQLPDNGGVSKILLQTDGKIVLHGSLNYGAGIIQRIRVFSNGLRDTSYTSNTWNKIDQPIILSDNKIFGIGTLIDNDKTENGYFLGAKLLNTNGKTDTNFPACKGINYPINKIVTDTAGNIYIAGRFSQYKNKFISHLLKLKTTGEQDTTYSYVGVTNAGSNGTTEIRSIALKPNNKLVIAGKLLYCNGYTYSDINGGSNTFVLKANGQVDSTYTSLVSIGAEGYNCAITLPGNKYIFGTTDQHSPTQFKNIKAADSLGNPIAISPYPTVPASVTDSVFSIAAQSDGKVVYGGYFTYNNPTIKNIARLNANLGYDAAFNLADQPNGTVYAVKVLPDDKILVGGAFTMMGQHGANGIARLNANGSFDTSFHIGTGVDGVVRDFLLQPDDKIVVSGQFTMYNGHMAGSVTRLLLNGDIDTSFTVNGGFKRLNAWTNSIEPGIVKTLALNNGLLLVGGDFAWYNDTVRNNIAQLNNSILYSGDPGDTLRLANTICQDQQITLSYKALGVFNQGNVFQLQLSDAAGNFANATVIGSNTGQTSGFVTGNIPGNMPVGTMYKLRVVATSPYTVGRENPTNYVMDAMPEAPSAFTIFTDSICAGQNAVLYTIPSADTLTYMWNYSGEGVSLQPNGDSLFIDFSATATSGILSVNALYSCAESLPLTAEITIKPLPVLTGFISAGDTAYQNQTNIEYTVNPGANYQYTWNYSGNDVVVNAIDNVAMLSFGPNATSGQLTVVAENDCGSDTLVVGITVLEPVGVNETISKQTTVYGTHGIVAVTSPVNCLFGLYDASGRLLMPTKNIKQGRTDIDVSGIANGIYFVRLYSDIGNVTRKIVVSN